MQKPPSFALKLISRLSYRLKRHDEVLSLSRSRQTGGHAWRLARRHPLVEEARALGRVQTVIERPAAARGSTLAGSGSPANAHAQPKPSRGPRKRPQAHPRRSAFESTRVASPRHDLNTGDDLLEAETIMQDVVQRRRRVFGPAHPDTRFAEGALSLMREDLAHE